MGIRLKKSDKVMVITGKDNGKSGNVLFVDRKKNRVIVEGLNIVKKTKRPDQQNQKGGIIDIESPINISNVMIMCAKCGKPVKVQKKKLEDGKSVRTCSKCGEILDKV